MDHSYIEEHNVADRYVLETLAADDRARFEEHFVDCPECLQRLENAERWRHALRIAAAENPGGAGPFAWLARLQSWRQGAVLVAAGLVVAAGPLVLSWREISTSRAQLEQLKTASADWQRRYRELTESRSEPAALPATLPVFSLALTRDAPSGEATSQTRIDLRDVPAWLVLSLETQSDRELLSYRASLATVQGRVVWNASGLKPFARNALGLTLQSGLLQKGDYVLTLEAMTRKGTFMAAGRYFFRVEN
jgi:hypothetical protein